jgi:hypothetical protein
MLYSALLAENARLKADLERMSRELAARKGKPGPVDVDSPTARAAWAATLKQASRLTNQQWEWQRIAAAELAAEARARASKPPTNKATPADILRSAAIAKGEVTPLPTDPKARAIIKAAALARNEPEPKE